MDPTRIALAAAQDSDRRAAASLLAARGATVVAQCADLAALAEALQRADADLALVDAALCPGRGDRERQAARLGLAILPLEWLLPGPAGSRPEAPDSEKPIRTIEDVNASPQARLRAAERAAAPRQTLVREVHHRIKNNLQAVVGLLRRQLGVHPELAGSLETAISQVNTVAIVHGLQGRDGTDDLRLIDLLAGIAVAAENVVERAVVLPPLAGLGGIAIDGEESVPIAMVLNELLTNALKHGRVGPNLPPVQVHIDRREPAVALRIENTFDDAGGPLAFVRSAQGGGLKLVQALLPARGATLSWSRKEPGILVAELVLSPPVLRLASTIATPQPERVRHESTSPHSDCR